jgi:two-component system phosphate regulon response regulator PhoB
MITRRAFAGTIAAVVPSPQKLIEAPPDLLIVEWMLPGMSGAEVCARLREQSAMRTLPIILLSSRGEEPMRLRGFSAGADDLVMKPFSMLELLARARASATRKIWCRERSAHAGDLHLDRETRRVRRGARDVHLNAKEFRLLEYLVERPGVVFSRDHLIERVWGPFVDITDRTVDVHIVRLRKALSRGRERDPILCERGAGYGFDETFGK